MARVLILGGGFAAVTAAQELTFRLGIDDEIMVVSKSPRTYLLSRDHPVHIR
jgi:NADH dehydrogenase FAD-containing subunit